MVGVVASVGMWRVVPVLAEAVCGRCANKPFQLEPDTLSWFEFNLTYQL